MLKSLKKRLAASEDGFTLIELMVVVLIIAILIAIAVPTFLGARQRAQDRAAQSDIRNAYTAAKVIYADAESFTAATAATLSTNEPSLTFVNSAPANDSSVHVVEGETTANSQNWLAVKYSKSGTYFGIGATNGGTVVKCKSTDPTAVDTIAECTGGW